ncbi:hypothetical protein [Roseisalinus antarcticus]|uniref:N-acetyldiaminobutyrate dehydratase n=1 Tax=Roseisalinus antarcticus TaxID=254357 RepID=A0A1Y5TRT5_9RHOB|nr:hypothetical protein [Roseisalinus antarcticus]SLN70711.1 hypothetical protein ROA7023_03465 [Roseisalinus antarcticus]
MPDTGLSPVTVIDSRFTRKPLPLVRGAGQAFAVLYPENGAEYRTFNVIELTPGDVTRDLSHAEECVYYIESGSGLIRDLSDDAPQDLVEGSMIHIGVGDSYRLEAGDAGMRLIGGCVPVDPALYDLTEEEGSPA